MNFLEIDEQHLPDDIPIVVDRAGISNLDVPLSIMYKEGRSWKTQHVVASVNAFARLPRHRKGVDMSRLPEVLFEHSRSFLTLRSFRNIVHRLKQRLGLEDVYLRFDFKFLRPNISPVTKKEAALAYDCSVSVLYPPYRHFTGVKVPVQTLCPCSRRLCLVDDKQQIGRGAHNQRAEVTVQVEVSRPTDVRFETLIKIVEKSASSPVYVILKRPDEKYVTEHAYRNPVFVEGLARKVAYEISKLKAVKWFRIKVESFESIHKHNAVAYIGRVRKGDRWYYSKRGFV